MESGLHKNGRRRLLLVQIALLLPLALVGVRFYDLQIRRHDFFYNKAQRQYRHRVKLACRR